MENETHKTQQNITTYTQHKTQTSQHKESERSLRCDVRTIVERRASFWIHGVVFFQQDGMAMRTEKAKKERMWEGRW